MWQRVIFTDLYRFSAGLFHPLKRGGGGKTLLGDSLEYENDISYLKNDKKNKGRKSYLGLTVIIYFWEKEKKKRSQFYDPFTTSRFLLITF